MKKQQQTSTDGMPEASFLGISGHTAVDWITQHGATLLTGLLASFFLLLGGYLWFSGNSSKAEADYQQAALLFQNFQKNDGDVVKQEESLKALSAIMVQQPNLHAEYDGAIAQTLIDRAQIKLAIPYAEATLKRIEADQLPFYREYSQITLLAAQNDDAAAIKNSLQLKGKMLQNMQEGDLELKKSTSGGLLFAFNLLRTAFLQQKIGDKEGEMKSWEEWKLYTNVAAPVALGPAVDSKALFTAANLFTEGSFTLSQYIDWRIKVLSGLQGN